jgi:mono/diheme cytochrome c family protein
MHIAMRTRSSPEWIWATFEQIDNERANKLPDGKLSHPNFFNPALDVPVNVLPPQNAVIDPGTGSPEPEPAGPPKATTWIESLTTRPVQVQRVVVPTQGTLNPLDEKIAQSTAALNAQVQADLAKAGSVFRYYELIGTQWPVHPNAPAFAGGEGSAPESITHKTPGDMVPVFLVNTTMETYFQKGHQPAGPLEQDDRLANGAPPIDSTMVTGTESCVGCHYSAGVAVGFKRNDDGSLKADANGRKIPIYGENGHFGKTGNAAFSWLLQIEAQATPLNGSAPVARERRPAGFLDIHRLDAQYGK